MPDLLSSPEIATFRPFNESEPIRNVITTIGNFQQGVQFKFSPRANHETNVAFTSGSGPEGNKIYTVASDINLKEFGSLLADVTSSKELTKYKPIFARKFLEEGIVLADLITKTKINNADFFGTNSDNSTVQKITEFLNLKAEDLKYIAHILDPNLQDVSISIPQDQRTQVLSRLQIDEKLLDSRVDRIAKILKGTNGQNILERYVQMVSKSVSSSLEQVIRSTLSAQLVDISTKTAYENLSESILIPQHYLDFLPPSMIKDFYQIDFRLKDNIQTLSQKYAKEINKIRLKRESGDLTPIEEAEFLNTLANEIVGYGGWSEEFEKKYTSAYGEYGKATESSSAFAKRTGRMNCIIRAALLGELMLETGIPQDKIMSVSLGYHAGLVVQLQEGRFRYLDFYAYEGDPGFNNWNLYPQREYINHLLLGLDSNDVVSFTPTNVFGFEYKGNVGSIHKGFKALTSLSLLWLGWDYYESRKYEEALQAFKIANTLDPVNPFITDRIDKTQDSWDRIKADL